MIDSSYTYLDNYNVYELTAADGKNTQTYYLSKPNHALDKPSMYLGFSDRSFNGTAADGDISQIKEISEVIFNNDSNSIYVVCGIDYDKLKEATDDNDNILYRDILKDITVVTTDVSRKFGELNQVINVVKHNEADSKFIDWLDITLGRYINVVSFKDMNRRSSDDDGSSIGPRTGASVPSAQTMDKPKVKKLVPPKATGHGFVSFNFVLVTMLSIVISLVLAFLILKLKS